MNCELMPCFEKVTILIHTKNRPGFLLRLLSYYYEKLGQQGIKVLVLDCSNEENFLEITEGLGRQSELSHIHVLHHPPSSSFPVRMTEALRLISTPYVLLAADDDLYFFDWLKPAVDLLNTDSSFGVVYGHTLRFELEEYRPYGRLIKFDFSRPNPPARWLEGDTPEARLTELGRSDWTTMGWYALQRTELFSIIVNAAKQSALDGFEFELLLVFCQAALTKTRMLDDIYLARQINQDEKRPLYSYKKERKSLEVLKATAVAILSKYNDSDESAAAIMVEGVFAAELCQLKENDSRRYLRKIADCFPGLRDLKYWFYGALMRERLVADPLDPDARFPPTPEVGLGHPKIKDIIQAVTRKQDVVNPV